MATETKDYLHRGVDIMTRIINKLKLILIFTITISIFLAHTPGVFSIQTSVPDKALSFIEDVIQLDTTKYTTTLVGCFLKNSTDYDMRYTLENNISNLFVKMKFIKNTLYFGRLIVVDGTATYTESPAINIIDRTKKFLERYQTYTGISDQVALDDFEKMRNILTNVDVLENLTTSANNMKLTIAINKDTTSFYWEDLTNNVNRPMLSIIFQGGTFFEIRDSWTSNNVEREDFKEESITQWIKSSNLEKVLSFIENVIQLDTTKYTTNLVSYSLDYPDSLVGMLQENVKYDLKTYDNELTILAKIKNNTLTYFSLTINKGTLFYVQPTTNVLDRTKILLEGYQNYSNDTTLIEMMNPLNSINTIKNITTTINNVKFRMTSRADFTSFRWNYIFNGAEYTGIALTTSEKGITFRDDRSIFKIGDTTVNVLKENAIETALERVENFSWKLTGGEEVTDFDIVDDPIGTELKTRPKNKESLTLYPYWDILLYLDDYYPGFVYAIEVGIWADTGEAFLCQPLTIGGQLENDMPITNISQSITGMSPEPGTVMVIIGTILLLVLISVTVLLKKRYK